ncbi:hypothetical protein EYZ11_010169 [Aspergillus tanneri]|uniref:Uncharacterized protein n=1 Tax=Aspergillus tanneri TaxID=1220188 RepID=A0A4S3J847_9EURO|nr:hypothetical protein EYZ11_010169 [Aspergillus tanneri]
MSFSRPQKGPNESNDNEPLEKHPLLSPLGKFVDEIANVLATRESQWYNILSKIGIIGYIKSTRPILEAHERSFYVLFRQSA